MGPIRSGHGTRAGTNICFVDPDHDLVVVMRWIADQRVGELLKKIEAVR